MGRKKVALYIINLLTIVCCSLLILPARSASAKSDEEFVNQALVNALDTCYLDSYTNKTVSAATGENAYSKIFTDTGKSSNIYLPFQASPISCRNVLTRVKTDVFGNQSNTTDLTNYGYQLSAYSSKPSDKTQKTCVAIEYQYFDTTWQEGKTQQYCFDINSDGSSGSTSGTIPGGSSGPYKFTAHIIGDEFYATFDEDKPSILNIDIFSVKQKRSETGAWEKFIDKINKELQKYGNKHSDTFASYVARSFPDPDYNATVRDLTYEKKSRTEAISTFLRFASGNSAANINNYAFSNQDKVDILQKYIQQELQKSNGGSGLSVVTTDASCWSDRNSVTAKYAYPISGRGWCELRNVESVSGNDYIIFSGNLIGGGRTFAKMMDQFMSLSKNANVNPSTSYDPSSNNNGSGSNGSTSSGGSSTTSELSACYQGAGVLGWIACPVIEAVGGATSYLYERVVEPLLEIKASTIMDRDKGAYSAWSAFRGFTNVLFAIGFAVVILAQLTGIGISNYNIKKILPRLIMVAVLVNVSFVICQFAVDISNLIGSGIENVFKALPMTYAAGGGSILAMGGIFSGLTAALGLTAVGAALSLPVAAATLSYWIWPILLGLLSCLVGILFFFIVLAVRQAGVIILVILSPIAIICYALPNTKSIFDRWRKMFTSLLVVYPICSLLMYGGQYAGALMLSINSGTDDNLGMFYTITAMLVMVLPFFAIPSILKGSMAMMGNIGAKISNFGNGVRGGLTRSIRGTRAFQEHQAEEQRRLNLRRDQTRVGRLSATGKGGGMVGRARRALGWNNNLSDRNMVRAALAQSNIDKTTDTTAQAMRARWESDGTINNLKELENKYKEATEKLMKDPGDEEALQMQKAASVALASTKPGRSHLYAANDDLINQVTTMTGDQRKAAENVMRRTANNLLRTNGGDIGKSPLLDEQLSQLQNPPDGSGGRTAGYEGIKDAMLHDSIGKLNARSMSEMYKKDLDAYLKAVDDGDIKGDDLRRLSAAARSAINDPRYNGMIGAEAMEKMRQLANLGYSQHAADADASSGAAWAGRTQSIATASNEEISRIREGLRNGSFDNGDTEAIKSTLAHSLMRAASGDGSYNMSTNRAEEINRILQENGIDLSSMDQAALDNLGATDYALTSDQIKNGIVNATGMKIEHPPAHKPTMRQLHPGWGQATAEQVRRAQIVNPSGPAIREGDWINVDDRGNIVRLRPDEVVEATKLMDREAEARINEGDERFNQQNNQQGSSS